MLARVWSPWSSPAERSAVKLHIHFHCRWQGHKVTHTLTVGPCSPTAGRLWRESETHVHTQPCRQPGRWLPNPGNAHLATHKCVSPPCQGVTPPCVHSVAECQVTMLREQQPKTQTNKTAKQVSGWGDHRPRGPGTLGCGLIVVATWLHLSKLLGRTYSHKWVLLCASLRLHKPN